MSIKVYTILPGWYCIFLDWEARCKHAHCATSMLTPRVSAQTNTPPVALHIDVACLLISVEHHFRSLYSEFYATTVPGKISKPSERQFLRKISLVGWDCSLQNRIDIVISTKRLFPSNVPSQYAIENSYFSSAEGK